MEQQVPSQQPPTQPPHSGKNWYKIGFVLLVVVLLGSAFVAGGYMLGNKQTQKETQASLSISPTTMTSSPTSTPSTANGTDTGIPMQENTVSFTRVGKNTYLQYRGKIYGEDEQFEPQQVTLPNEQKYTWYGLVDAPKNADHTLFDEVFSFKTIPNTRNFIFVMRYTLPPGSKPAWSLPVYYYNQAASEKLSLVLPPGSDVGTNSVPKISEISSDGDYVSFSMFPCWNCGGSHPETRVMNLKTAANKSIGKTSYFAWKTNGSYEYKEYVTKPCPTPTGNPEEFMQGECSEDPKNLPLKTGQI